MRSPSISTLALFVIVAVTAIVGVAHAAEARTATAAAPLPTAVSRPTDTVGAEGRWWMHAKPKPRPSRHCIRPTVTIPNGVIVAPCGSKVPPHKKCCEGYYCKTEGDVSINIETGTRKYDFLELSTTAPYNPTAGAGVPLNPNFDECCLPSPDFDVTELSCTPGEVTVGGCPTEFVVNIDLADFDAAVNTLACACCTGILGLSGDFGNFAILTCNPSDLTTVAPPGQYFLGYCGGLAP
jgi:hypothetical protein